MPAWPRAWAKDSRTVRERVRTLRKTRGLSQEGLAYEAGLDRTYVGGVERGERNIGLLDIQKLADALGISPKELM